MRKIYILPGFGENGKELPYSELKNELMQLKKGTTIDIVNINWKYKVMSDYVSQFINKVKRENVGFSFSSFIALASSLILTPEAIVLCSLLVK